jgi:hypothetical protein
MIWKGHRLQHYLYQNVRTWGGQRLIATSSGKTVLTGKMGLPTKVVGLTREPLFEMAALVFPLLC